tara:strand:- start:1200 stop:1883 length:684 start_codon:yes stop_codon:yes gene_type:complete
MVRIRILKEQRLNEDKRGNIVRLLGYDKETADRFHKVSPKYSFFLARTHKEAKAQASERGHYTGGDFTTDFIHRMLKILKKYPNEFQNIKNLPYTDVEKHIEDIERKQQLKEDTILTFDDGFFWYDTYSNECQEWIATKMQHCGEDLDGHLQILFDDKLEPHVTLTWNKFGDTVEQIKGKQNETPRGTYWKYIKKLMDEFNLWIFDRHQTDPRVLALNKYLTTGELY